MCEKNRKTQLTDIEIDRLRATAFIADELDLEPNLTKSDIYVRELSEIDLDRLARKNCEIKTKK